MIEEHANKILDYWFNPDGNHDNKKWFINSKSYDDEIKEKFSEILALYENKKGIEWLKTKKTFLAYIIMMDQLSRHIYRDTVNAYKNDKKALLIAEMGIDTYLYKLNGYELLFAFMPYSHKENSLYHIHADKIIDEIKIKGDFNNKITNKIEKHYYGHKNIINTFGRFPKRNRNLNRVSTELENKYLEAVKFNFY